MKIKYIVIAFAIAVLFGCKAKQISSLSVSQGSEEEYIATFTEATKYALLGDYKNAVGLFNLCIKKFPDRAGPYYQLSNIYYSFKDIENSKKFGKRAVELNDENLWYLLHLSNIYHFEKNIDTIIILYEKIVSISENPEYKYNLSVFYSQNGEMDKSMQIVEELENEIPDAQEILRLKHMNYSAMKMQDSAIAQLEKLVKLFPSDIDNYGLLAEYLSEINKFQHAKKIYQELLEFEPNNGLANFSYGDFFLKQGKRDSALFYYKRGFVANDIGVDDKIGLIMNFMYDPIFLRSDTLFIESLINILKINYPEYNQTFTVSAEYNIKQQNYSDGLADLGVAIDKGNESEVVWEQYIMLCGMLKKYEKVDSLYQSAINRFPDNMNIYIYSSYALYELREVDKLISLCDSAILLKNIKIEEKTQLMNFIADGYRWKKEYHKSDSVFEEILEIDSDNLIVRNNYAYYLSLRNENIEKALELSSYTVDKEPNNPTFLDTYGWILFVQGNYKESFKFIEKAIKNGANRNPEVLDHYGDVLQKLNRCKEAIEAWNHAIKYSESDKENYREKIRDAKEICK
jgi:tetratricopeptide (TPR) repeat protein